MTLVLTPELQRLIEERVKAGKYATPEEVIAAALHSLEHEETAGDFQAGEWNALLAQGEQSGEALEGESVLQELRDLRSKHPSKAG